MQYFCYGQTGATHKNQFMLDFICLFFFFFVLFVYVKCVHSTVPVWICMNFECRLSWMLNECDVYLHFPNSYMHIRYVLCTYLLTPESQSIANFIAFKPITVHSFWSKTTIGCVRAHRTWTSPIILTIPINMITYLTIRSIQFSFPLIFFFVLLWPAPPVRCIYQRCIHSCIVCNRPHGKWKA